MAKKSTLTQVIARCMMRVAVIAILMSVSASTLRAIAAESDVPEITIFYPGKNDEAPMELRPGTVAYVYFAIGSTVESAKAVVTQNGNELGTLTYRTKTTPGTVLTMNPTADENVAALAAIQPGTFTFSFYEVTYVADGTTKTYTSQGQPLGTVTYLRKIPNGTIVSTSGLEDQTVKSYYSPEGTEGVRTYTFDRPVIKDGIQAYFEYGQLNTYIITDIPWSISDDCKTITVDLRGKCYNVDALAPGVTFYDEFGNPCPPPTEISINVTGLDCPDGTRISTTSKSLEGDHQTELEGRIFESYHYVDLSFVTPVLTQAEFYAKSAPTVRYSQINANTDMMDLSVSGASYIKTADLSLNADGVHVVIPAAEITKERNVYTVNLPESIINAGSDHLIVSLVNVEYYDYDGADHTIKPLDLSHGGYSITTIDELKSLPEGTEVTLNSIDGIKVTLSNDLGYTFAEDATGGLQIVTSDYSKALNEGTLVKGMIKGTYHGNGLFMIDQRKSVYSEENADVKLGTKVDNITSLTDGSYNNCLVTIVASEYFDIVNDQDAEMMLINSYLPVMTDFVDVVEFPTNITNITGIYYFEPNLGQAMIIVRSLADFNQDIPSSGINSIIGTTGTSTEVYDLRGVKVSDDSNIDALQRGIYIINGQKVIKH